MTINSRSNKVARSIDQFAAQLDRQLRFLRSSCAGYDEGDHEEAVRIAITLRVLLHDTSKSTSLLTHLGIKCDLSYVDTGIYRTTFDQAVHAFLQKTNPTLKNASSSATDVGLVEPGDAGDGMVGWFAPLRLIRFPPNHPKGMAMAMRPVASFQNWWNDKLIESSSGKAFSRSDLVLIMANQDGGGHVDAEIDRDYADLIIDPLMQAMTGPNTPSSPSDGSVPDVLHNVAFASVRQIAFEFIVTMMRYEYAKSTPGVFALAAPFAELQVPPPPHCPLNIEAPLVLTEIV